MKPSTSSLYSVYGLCVRSELQLDGVPEGRGEADVIIRRGEVQARAQHPVQAGCFEADAQRIFIYQPGAGFLLAQAGRELIVEVPPDHDAYFMQSVVLGRGLAAVLHQRDVLTLHAGAVADGEAALAFIGERGDGKSTTTSALVRHGCRLVTDDLLPIRVGADSAPRVYTGGAQVKLWPASLATASDDAAAHPRVSDAVDKRYWAADAPFEAAEAPLRAVYELAFGNDFAAEPYAARAAFAALNRHAFTGGLALVTDQGPSHMMRVAEVVRHVPVFRLVRPRDLSRLDAFVAFAREHAARL